MPHMLPDFARFEATEKRPSIRNTPKELLDIPSKIGEKSILPKMEASKAEFKPLAEVTPENKDILKTSEPKIRKQPVRSKAKK
jgi:hypothetical protein